jgi:hypothetical protein
MGLARIYNNFGIAMYRGGLIFRKGGFLPYPANPSVPTKDYISSVYKMGRYYLKINTRIIELIVIMHYNSKKYL